MSKISLPIIAVVPVVVPFEFPMFDLSRHHLSLALDGLAKLSGSFSIRIPFADMTLPVSIKIMDDPKSIPGDFSKRWRPHPEFTHKFVCFTAQADIDDENTALTFAETPRTLGQMKGIERDLACLAFADDFGLGVCHVFTAITIGLPAAFRTVSPTVIVEGIEIGSCEIPELHTEFESALKLSLDQGWPPVRDISVLASWEWFSRLPGLQSGMVSGPVGRAVAALSHIIYPESPYGNSGNRLVWALLGLEAIYGRGSGSISEQLREKSELLFGVSSNNKKRLTTAYQFRSRFIHGDLDIPFQYTEALDENKKILKFGNEQWDAALFAEALLVSTLQELVIRNTHEILFSYTIKTSP